VQNPTQRRDSDNRLRPSVGRANASGRCAFCVRGQTGNYGEYWATPRSLWKHTSDYQRAHLITIRRCFDRDQMGAARCIADAPKSPGVLRFRRSRRATEPLGVLETAKILLPHRCAGARRSRRIRYRSSSPILFWICCTCSGGRRLGSVLSNSAFFSSAIRYCIAAARRWPSFSSDCA